MRTNLPSEPKFRITCDDENDLLLSNEHTKDIWTSFEKLMLMLVNDDKFSSMDTLFAWKGQAGYKATSREAYAWRNAIEEIKNSNLMDIGKGLSESELLLVADKPAMLKVAGEVTNALLHSYTRGHAITFRAAQNDSKVPS